MQGRWWEKDKKKQVNELKKLCVCQSRRKRGALVLLRMSRHIMCGQDAHKVAEKDKDKHRGED